MKGPEMTTKITDLRKIYSAQGVKGFSSANREDFNTDIEAAWDLALLSEASRESAKVVKPVAPKSDRSRAGMVIVAKGSEIHKSKTFKAAATAADWEVAILGSVIFDADGEEIERFVARATKGDNLIELAWNGRAYDYPNSYAIVNGKTRKVRNLKEALRFL